MNRGIVMIIIGAGVCLLLVGLVVASGALTGLAVCRATFVMKASVRGSLPLVFDAAGVARYESDFLFVAKVFLIVRHRYGTGG